MSDKPIIIYPEYFDFSLKRSEGRKVPANISVKRPSIDELYSITKSIGTEVKKSSKSHPSNWNTELGSINLFYEGKKMALLHKIGKELKNLRKTD
jgi:signal recognition particle subunit SEC65